MIDPSKLWAGASAVYGEAVMEREYGRLRPVPAERVVEAADGHPVDLAGRILRCLDTPGHAKHHIAIHDAKTQVCFTGDVFGLSYREFDTTNGPFILPTTSPVQFDPEELHASIHRLIALQPVALYPTHFGRIEDVEPPADVPEQPELDVRGPDAEVAGHPPAEAEPEEGSAEFDFFNEQRLSGALDQALEAPLPPTDEHLAMPQYKDAPESEQGGIFGFEWSSSRRRDEQAYEDDPSG